MSTGAKSPLLRVAGLTVRYPPGGRDTAQLEAVRNVSLDIPERSIVALVGESGSGKTTLAHAILQLQPVAGGRVLFRGKDLVGADRHALAAMRRSIQPVFQDPLAALSPRRTVRQTLREPLDHFRIGESGQRDARALEALGTVELDGSLMERYPHELSGGQRQRVALARALVSGPELVIADEPVSSLDVSMQARVVDLIRGLRDRLGVAFLFVSHDLAVVRRLADTVAVMYAGQLVESGPAAAVFEAPAHPYTRALLNAVPAPDPAAPQPRVLGGEPPSPLTPPSGCVFHTRCSEAMPQCAATDPAEHEIAARGNELANHRVRCHLWNA
jgi:oligopeptide/dipeptide ABC transporter ATP-binding protein